MDDLSVRPCVGLSSALWKNGGSDPDAVWHHRSDGFRDEAGLRIGPRKGVLLGAHLGRAIQWGVYGVGLRVLRTAQRRVPLAKLLWANLLLLLLKTGSYRNALDCCQKLLRPTLYPSHCLNHAVRHRVQDKNGFAVCTPRVCKICYPQWIWLHPTWKNRLQNDLDNKWRNENYIKKDNVPDSVRYGTGLACTWRAPSCLYCWW